MVSEINLNLRAEQAPASGALRHKPFVDALLDVAGPQSSAGPVTGARSDAGVDPALPERGTERELSRSQPLSVPFASAGTSQLEDGRASRATSTRFVPRAATQETIFKAGRDQEIDRGSAAVDPGASTEHSEASVGFVPFALRLTANFEREAVPNGQVYTTKDATTNSTSQGAGNLMRMVSLTTQPAPAAVTVPPPQLASGAVAIGDLPEVGLSLRTTTPVAVATPIGLGRRPGADEEVSISNEPQSTGKDIGAFDLSLLRNHLAVLRRLPDGRLVIQVSSPALGRIDFEVENREGASPMVAQASRPDVEALLQSLLRSAGGSIGRLSDTSWRTLIRQLPPTAGQRDVDDEPGTCDTAGAGGKVVADGGVLQAII